MNAREAAECLLATDLGKRDDRPAAGRKVVTILHLVEQWRDGSSYIVGGLGDVARDLGDADRPGELRTCRAFEPADHLVTREDQCVPRLTHPLRERLPRC